MSVKNAFVAVLKAMRAGKGLTQRNLAEFSSRTYASKLERGQSSPTFYLITALSGPLNVHALPLVAITICAESGESVNNLLRRTQEELVGLAHDGILNNLTISSGDELLLASPSTKPSTNRSATNALQVEFCFGE